MGADQENVSIASPAVRAISPITAGLDPSGNILPPLPAAMDDIKGIVIFLS